MERLPIFLDLLCVLSFVGDMMPTASRVQGILVSGQGGCH